MKIKSIVTASIGNALEWYDFGLYGFFATTLQQVFFPFQSSTGGLLSVFLVFAVGLFMRPLGGVVFGYLGDKIGRKPALIVSIFAIAIPTCLIGVLPSFKTAGFFAVILFVIARLLQGLSVGGEFIGSMVFLSECSPPKRRGLYCSLIYCFGTCGGFLGSLSGILLHLFLSETDITAWGWRLPFLFGIIPAAFGIYIRLKINETPLFAQLEKENQTAKKPFTEAIKSHPKEIVITFLLTSFQTVGYYLTYVYLVTWLIRYAHFSSSTSFIFNALGFLLLILLIPIFGALSDRIGRKKILMAACITTLILAYPLFLAFSTTPFLSICLFSLLVAMYQGPLPATYTALVPTKHRYMSLAIGYNTSAAVFGGMTPFLATLLIAYTGVEQSPSFLLMATAIIAFCALILIKSNPIKSHNK